jgi:hypothetical protein
MLMIGIKKIKETHTHTHKETVVGVGEGSSVSVDVVSGLDLTSLHSVDEQTHLPFSLPISLCNALLSISLFTLLMSKFFSCYFFFLGLD